MTGAGKGFCAGADMDELKNAPNDKSISADKDGKAAAEHQVSTLMRTKTEEALDSDEALSMGLVNRVFPTDGFMAYTSQLAETVSPRSLRVIKGQVYNGLFQSLAKACEQADEELLLSLKSEDFQEGVAHFF